MSLRRRRPSQRRLRMSPSRSSLRPSQLTPGGSGGSSLEDLEANRQMPDDLVNTEHIDVNDGYNGEIPALLDC